MKRILVVGAGRSSVYLIDYLLDHAYQYKWHIVVGDYNKDLASQRVAHHKSSSAIFFNVNDSSQRFSEIKKSDIVISMLPPDMHYLIAQDCVVLSKNLVTASYVSSKVQALDKKAKKKNILLLNELGLDPGIDHMSAMQMIDNIKRQEGKIKSFKSFCGGLIHPDYDDNIWNYKFTWNPRNVVLAGKGNSQFLQNNIQKELSYKQVFNHTEDVYIPDLGHFEGYPNRDSLHYQKAYGLEGLSCILRGTLRKKGFCKSWNMFVQLGITKDDTIIKGSDQLTYRKYFSMFLKPEAGVSLEEAFCKKFNISKNSIEFQKIEWLDLFSEKKIQIPEATSAQILQYILEKKWKLSLQDRDMIVMQHQFEYLLKNKSHKSESSLVVYGEGSEKTAMAKTVGLPVAIAAKLILNNQLTLKGVCIPVYKEIYEPVLNELKQLGILFNETSS